MGSTVCTPSAHRRRGDELIGAIRAATLAELVEHGWAGLTVEGVADRAGVGKASIYRRWPGKLELALDAIDQVLPDLVESPDTGSIRGDLIAMLRTFSTAMNGPCGALMRSAGDPDADELRQAVEERLVAPRRNRMLEVMRRAIARGEIRGDAARPRIAEVGPMLLHAELMRHGRVGDRTIVGLVDEVLLPMLRP